MNRLPLKYQQVLHRIFSVSIWSWDRVVEILKGMVLACLGSRADS